MVSDIISLTIFLYLKRHKRLYFVTDIYTIVIIQIRIRLIMKIYTINEMI